MSSVPFRDLTRLQRLYRFRQLAKVALCAYGMADAKLNFLQYGENVIYRVDPVHGRRALLRLHAWDNVPYINSEMLWLDALASEGGLSVPRPIHALDGALSVQVEAPDLGVTRVATLLSWLEGRKLKEGLRPVHLVSLGRVVAQLHEFSAGWQPPEDFDRPDWDWAAQLGGSHFSVSVEELVASMPVRFREPFVAVSQEAKAVMTDLGTGSDAYGLIHADLYPENVLFKAGQAYPIDFEDCGYGWWIWDIAVALCIWAWEPGWERMRDAFCEGYESVRSLPAVQWDLLDLFIATQYATMLIWACAFLQHDPQREDEYVPWRDESGERMLNYFNR